MIDTMIKDNSIKVYPRSTVALVLSMTVPTMTCAGHDFAHLRANVPTKVPREIADSNKVETRSSDGSDKTGA
jgi:hypothetical protein